MKKFRITLTRKVVESVTLNVEGRTEREALFAVGLLVGGVQEADWSREVEDSRVGKVERGEEPKGDPMDVPAELKRTA